MDFQETSDDETHQGCEPVDEVVGHVEELELVGRRGEGGAHDEVHLHLESKFSDLSRPKLLHSLLVASCPES